MGLLSKFKNIFVEEYEEEEIEIPEKKIEKKERDFEPFVRQQKPEFTKIEPEAPIKPIAPEKPVNIPKPEPEIKPIIKEEETIKIETPPKKEEKFIFPVYFDEKDFEAEKKEPKPAPRVEKKVEIQPRREVKIETKEVKTESSYKEAYNKKTQVREERHIFKPTPIISPVYGILDKNYYKEDIVVSTPNSRTHYTSTSKTITIDDVRNKAFGSLEDELADTILTDEKEEAKTEIDNDIINEKDFEFAVEEDKKRDIGKDNLKSDIEALLNNDEFTSALNFKKTKIEDIPEKKEKKEEKKIDDDDSLIDDIVRLATDEDENFETDKKSKEVKINTEEDNSYEDANDLADNDLFSLIDSMYDKEDK